MDYDISIVLCTINEKDALPKIVASIEENVSAPYQLVFVDDGSTDGTKEFLKEYSETHNNCKTILNGSKRSLIIADSIGIENSDGKYVIIMDADLQHPVSKINEVYSKLKEGYDVVVCSRYSEGGSTGNRKPLRGFISRVAAAMVRIYVTTSRKTTDPLSGFFGFKRSLKLQIDKRWWGYKTLLFLIASNPGVKLGEVPYKFVERNDGKSKIVSGPNFLLSYIVELILIKRLEARTKKFTGSNNIKIL